MTRKTMRHRLRARAARAAPCAFVIALALGCSSKSTNPGGGGAAGAGAGGAGAGGAAGGGSGGSATGGSAGAESCTLVTPAPSQGSCYTAGDCNPLTNDGCSQGWACDTNLATGKFTCYAPPNLAQVCAPCDNDTEACRAGSTCLDGRCIPWCCTDADCSIGKCRYVPLADITVTTWLCDDVKP